MQLMSSHVGVSPPKSWGFVINPGANRARASGSADLIRKHAASLWPDAGFFITSDRDDIVRTTKEACSKFGGVVACGGDGTINLVLETAIKLGVPCGIVPIGSGNDLVKSLGIPRDIPSALRILKSGVAKDTDYIKYHAVTENGLVEGISVNTLGAGFDGQVNYETSTMKRVKGPLMYAIAAVKTAFRYQPFHMTRTGDTGRISQDLLMLNFANGRVEGGNFTVAPFADLWDGKVDVVEIPPVGLFTLFTRLPLFNLGMPHKTGFVHYSRVEACKVEFDPPVPMHSDGEQVGRQVRSLEIEVVPQGIQLMLPPDLR